MSRRQRWKLPTDSRWHPATTNNPLTFVNLLKTNKALVNSWVLKSFLIESLSQTETEKCVSQLYAKESNRMIWYTYIFHHERTLAWNANCHISANVPFCSLYYNNIISFEVETQIVWFLFFPFLIWSEPWFGDNVNSIHKVIASNEHSFIRWGSAERIQI